MMTDYLKDKPKLAEWLGDKNNEGYMVADLEALTNILPYLAVAKADSSDDEYHLAEAIEAVSCTIVNLRNIQSELFT